MKLAPALLFAASIVVCGCSSSSADSDNGLRVMKDTKPEGSITMDKEEMSSKMGFPIYPGADAPSGQSTVTTGATESRFALVLNTADSTDKVAKFYKSKLPMLNGGSNAGAMEYLGTTTNKSSLHLKISGNAGKTTIRAEAVVENSSAGAKSAAP